MDEDWKVAAQRLVRLLQVGQAEHPVPRRQPAEGERQQVIHLVHVRQDARAESARDEAVAAAVKGAWTPHFDEVGLQHKHREDGSNDQQDVTSKVGWERAGQQRMSSIARSWVGSVYHSTRVACRHAEALLLFLVGR